MAVNIDSEIELDTLMCQVVGQVSLQMLIDAIAFAFDYDKRTLKRSVKLTLRQIEALSPRETEDSDEGDNDAE